MMIKRIAISGIVFTGLVTVLYACLGGFNETILSYAQEEDAVHLSGKLFEGKYNDSELGKLFFEVKDLYKTLGEGHTLVVVNYPHEREEEGFVHQFIAIQSPEPIPLPEGWEYRQIQNRPSVEATIQSHNLVMPRPNKIRAQASRYAADQGVNLDNYSIERYHSEWQLVVSFPVKDSF
jgi:hypothetical protein